MKNASSAALAFFPTARKFFAPNLYTITLVDGRVFRWTDAPSSLTVGGNTFLSAEPYFKFKGQRSGTGLETATLDLELLTAQTALIGSVPILQAILNGIFDDATVQRDVLPMPTWGDTSLGVVTMFLGNWSDLKELDRTHATPTIKGLVDKLQTPFPPFVFQSGCQWPLYGPGCTLSKAAFGVNGTLTGSPGSQLFTTTLTNVDGYFNQGTIMFTSGSNSGLEFALRGYLSASGEILLFTPTTEPPAFGDAFTAYPGCDHTFATCGSKFSNSINFFGQDQIPVPETAV